MRQLALVLVLVLWTPLLAAQSCQPPTHVATVEPHQFTHYLLAPGQSPGQGIPQILPNGYSGALQLLDLATNAAITISRMDVSLSDDGATNWGMRYYGIPLPSGLVGQTAAVNVYTMPGSWLDAAGGTTNAFLRPGTPGSPWSFAASGTLTVADRFGYSSAVFASPFMLPAGSFGMAIEIAPVTSAVSGMPGTVPPPYSLHPRLVHHPHAPGVPVVAGDQFVQFSNHRIMSDAFVAMAPANITNIVDIHYAPPANAAWFSAFGAGCYDRPNALYELFVPPSFDMAGLSFQLQPVASQYIVAPSSNNIVTPTSAPVTDAAGSSLGGDALSQLLTLPFQFPYPGGSTNQIKVAFNGFVLLDPANSGTQRSFLQAFGVPGFLHSPPLIAPLWGDHEWGSTPGTVHLDIASSGQSAYITWWNVEEFEIPTTPYTFQLVLHASGAVEFHYDHRCVINGDRSLVGWTPGWTAHDPGGVDLSSGTTFLTGDGAVPPALTMDARPILGTTPKLLVRDLPPGAASFALIGLAPMTPALDLTIVGMPGCLEHVSPVVAGSLTPASSTTAYLPLAVPNDPTLVGARLFAQVVASSAGSNALGLTVSNALCIHL